MSCFDDEDFWACHVDDDRLATMSEADAHYANELGRDRPHSRWILSDREVWYRNTHYVGPHPDDPPMDAEDDDYPTDYF